MNNDHIALFVRIANTNNISLAGRELNLSPAVASAYISKLEDSLGVRLIHRTTRKVSLTEEGEAFLPHAEEVLATLETARASVGAGSLVPQGTLRITAPASFGRMHIVPALKSFTQKYPDLTIDCRFSDAIVDLVEGGFDIAIRDAALKDSNLIARKLATDSRIVCASPEYIAKNGLPKTPQDLVNHHTINLAGVESWAFKAEQNTLNIKTKGALRFDNGEAVRDACAMGLGVTISSNWCSYEHLNDGRLVEILKDYPLVANTAIWAVYPSNRLLAPKVRAFIDHFIEYFGETPYWEK